MSTIMHGISGIVCGYCGRPMAAGIPIGLAMYHEECTHGPGWQPRPQAPTPTSDERIRELVLQEVIRLGLVAVRNRID